MHFAYCAIYLAEIVSFFTPPAFPILKPFYYSFQFLFAFVRSHPQAFKMDDAQETPNLAPDTYKKKDRLANALGFPQSEQMYAWMRNDILWCEDFKALLEIINLEKRTAMAQQRRPRAVNNLAEVQTALLRGSKPSVNLFGVKPKKSQFTFIDHFAWFLKTVTDVNTEEKDGLFNGKDLLDEEKHQLVWQAYLRCRNQTHESRVRLNSRESLIFSLRNPTPAELRAYEAGQQQQHDETQRLQLEDDSRRLHAQQEEQARQGQTEHARRTDIAQAAAQQQLQTSGQPTPNALSLPVASDTAVNLPPVAPPQGGVDFPDAANTFPDADADAEPEQEEELDPAVQLVNTSPLDRVSAMKEECEDLSPTYFNFRWRLHQYVFMKGIKENYLTTKETSVAMPLEFNANELDLGSLNLSEAPEGLANVPVPSKETRARWAKFSNMLENLHYQRGDEDYIRRAMHRLRIQSKTSLRIPGMPASKSLMLWQLIGVEAIYESIERGLRGVIIGD